MRSRCKMDSFGWKKFGYIPFYQNNHKKKEKLNKQTKKKKKNSKTSLH